MKTNEVWPASKKENTLTMIDAIDSTHQVFISYATPDRERVLPFYNHLNAAGFVTWMDFKSIMPGQNWDFEIKKALDRSQAILIFISHNSVERRSYLQKEMKIALENFTEKLISDIYIIPIMLDDVDLPEQLNNIQSVKSSDGDCLQKVVDSIRFQFEKLGIAIKKKQESHHVSWGVNEIMESWEGLPGYSVSFQELIFQSKFYEKIHEINVIMKSDIVNELQESRKVKFEQNPERFNHAQDLFSRENTHDSSFGEPFFKGKILSISRAIHWYGAGAAHPNYHFQTYVYSLSPLFKINSLEEVFKESNNALEYLQSEIRKQLLLPRNPEEQLEDQYYLDEDWIVRGTEKWDDFSCFLFKEETLEIMFSPYHVSAYACGAQFVEIPYNYFAFMLRKEFIDLLDIHFHAFHPKK